MNDFLKPNAYLMRGALPSVERSRDEYTGSVFGAAALAYITIIHTTEALDMMQERLPELYESRQIKKFINRMTGTKASMGEIRRLTLSIGDLLAHDCDRAWVMDFGNAAYERVQPYTEKLRVALANALGKYNVPDINVCAAILVAQSLASEAVEYVKRRASKFTNFTITMKDKGRQTVSSCLSSMSCATIEYCLRNIARILVEDKLTDDVDLTEDKSVETGLKAVLNVMADTNTWIYARDKADELNNVEQKIKTMKKEIDAWIYNPTRSLFKTKKTEKAVGHIIYCECPEKCELYAKHKCVVYNNKCPHGSRGSVIGYSVMARKFSSWIKDFEEAHKDVYRTQLSAPKKLEYFMGYVYIPIAHLNLNDKIDFYDGGGFGSMRRPIIRRSMFTADFINDKILNFIPRSYFGNAEIKDYQEKEVPKFLNWLKELDIDLYNKVRELNPQHKGFAAMTNVGRKAKLKTLSPNIGEFKDIHGGLWTWDGMYITSKNTKASFTLIETREIEECRIKPKDDVVVQITDEEQVNENTEFID